MKIAIVLLFLTVVCLAKALTIDLGLTGPSFGIARPKQQQAKPEPQPELEPQPEALPGQELEGLPKQQNNSVLEHAWNYTVIGQAILKHLHARPHPQLKPEPEVQRKPEQEPQSNSESETNSGPNLWQYEYSNGSESQSPQGPPKPERVAQPNPEKDSTHNLGQYSYDTESHRPHRQPKPERQPESESEVEFVQKPWQLEFNSEFHHPQKHPKPQFEAQPESVLHSVDDSWPQDFAQEQHRPHSQRRPEHEEEKVDLPNLSESSEGKKTGYLPVIQKLSPYLVIPNFHQQKQQPAY